MFFTVVSPAAGQEISPVVTVDFPRVIAPTTFITGQHFVQIVRLRFIDLSHKGEEILIREDDLSNLKFWGDFEVIDVLIDKRIVQKDFVEHVWYVKFILRIVKEKKGGYKLPPITVSWARKKIGQSIDDPSVVWRNDIKTAEVPVNYVTTTPDDPYLDIRDQNDLGDPSRSALIWRIVGWFLAIFPLVVWVAMLVRYLRAPAVLAPRGGSGGQADADVIPIDPEYLQEISERKAFRNLRRSVAKLRALSNSKDIDAGKLMSKIQVDIMAFLRTQVQESTAGTTPVEMKQLILSSIEDKKPALPGWRLKALSGLADEACIYQKFLESEAAVTGWPVDSKDNFRNLNREVGRFGLFSRITSSLRELPLRAIFWLFRKLRK
ncbi:MAG: hypothetical protein A3B99_02145 [Candidatus Yanofskybacteria bacterium RIFCSPHIGHO2_02_FULL_44_12b]|nr:MAG: hypothetical protein A2659_04220 [Candidatus Yanofskybacteria bacterium RIFCSPHIGHO2_01_FULL_44_24]OGN15259.1 MAG: hypothetical protein A3B99_02145 [Candidatus Yanofskybacteria bacterium RIFCSPHIGHO2_02_FULL_44_12b]